MKSIRQEIGIWVQLLTFVGIWVSILYFSKSGLRIGWESIKKLPDVVTVYVLLHFIFTRWGWKIPFLQGWLVPFPNLQGTWKGTLQTTWIDPNTGQTPNPIQIIFVIRQSFSAINCTMFTRESMSKSNASHLGEDAQTKMLSFNYTNTPNASIRDRSKVHDGAALLRIISEPRRQLHGEYWTNRRTTGEISLSFYTKKLLEAFPDIEEV